VVKLSLFTGLIKKGFGVLGVDVRMHRNIRSARTLEKHAELVRKWRLLEQFRPQTILDVGANEGQCAALLREAFPDARIISFEPLEDCYEKVRAFHERAGNGLALRCALGDHDGKSVIHRNAFSPSSSLLPMNPLHVEEFPQTKRSFDEDITIRRMDSVLDDLSVNDPLVIKLDVQGFEDRVIKGGRETFRRASAVVLELTSYPLYDDQANFDDINTLLRGLGYTFRGVVDQSHSTVDGRILQFDGLFENCRS